jgi:(5-formylfuran-3-yl)methyl phosphate synthase
MEFLRRRGLAFLASVTSAAEAEIALGGGADIIDCKNPSAGALGALPVEVVREIVKKADRRVPVSATIGDLPSEGEVLLKAAIGMAASGADIIKVGFFGSAEDVRAAATFVGGAWKGPPTLVAVVMADRDPNFALIDELGASGFTGVMLDTADKAQGRLTTLLPEKRLKAFVRRARANGLFAGLAGSLRTEDIMPLARAGADILGFRGALCGSDRTSGIEATCLADVRAAIDAAEVEMREASVA